MPVLSVLDLSPITAGANPSKPLDNSLRLAQHTEALGYHRYWVAEHHNMPGIACAASAVVIGHIAGGTTKLRVGSGGIMLPNHSPLMVAEQFGTLAALYPNRIDLGLGRAPGTDPLTMRALRRDRVETEEDFPRDVQELQRLLGPAQPGQPKSGQARPRPDFWKFGNLGPGNLEIWDPKHTKNKDSQNQNPCRPKYRQGLE